MGKLYSICSNAMDRLNKVIGYVLALFLSVMVAVIFYQVFSRFVMGSSTSWSEELARILMLYIILLGAAIAIRRGQLLAVEVLPDILKGNAKRNLSIITNVFSALFCAILVFYGYGLALNVSSQTLPGLGVSMFWMYFALPFGGLLILVNAVFNIWSIIREVKK
ncbi:TRAP transporter small permease [Psychrobacillus soli]|uniref:TRAP transporter small permease n=1 Tax=Psychrobacillus soli TaxID=1543965 RepID=A0A544TMT7_9BACI|nr:TRAP transporter small permease [Psychrobacillus soli]TQR18773.1 TRAP transporter small permease [Psychrobacillus soli]